MIRLEWKEEKELVKGIFDEKQELDRKVPIIKKDGNRRLEKNHTAIIEKHRIKGVTTESNIEDCFSALEKQDRKIIILSYVEGLTNYKLAEALNVSERTVATYKRNATINFASTYKLLFGNN